MQKVLPIFLVLLCSFSVFCNPGYRVGNVTNYKLLASHNKSNLYQVECAQLDDGRPIQLIQLVGSHYQVGYAYAALVGPDIVTNYHTFLGAEFNSKLEIFLLENFLDWQYDTFVSEQIPNEFKQQLKGLQNAGEKQHKIHNLRAIFQRTLVVSSYPGDFGNDIMYTLLDEFIRKHLIYQNQQLVNIIEQNLFHYVKLIKNFLNKKRIHCSFFAMWGNRTEGGKLITMRNLDWQANTGMNKHKMVFVWKIDNTIPHMTLGFPGLLGALTGMSKAGLTVHEAGLDSMRATQLGFQWSLRLRYVMMHAQNLKQARAIWQATNNTLGMNHMIASAADLVSDHPAMVMETMRNYTAFFKDNDERQRQAIFTDPKTKQKFRAGWAMEQAVFRTNHAYDPFINKYRTMLPTKNDSTIRRYTVLKESILNYNGQRVKDNDALNITANTAHKGGDNPYKCTGDGDQGTNVISAVYFPAELRVYAGFEYSGGDKYRTACCGVYVHFQMGRWLN